MTKQKSNFGISFKNFFKFDAYGAILKKEIIGGLSTFLAMAYILAVNPAIVSSATNNKLQGGLFLATAIASCLATLFMGLFARIPVALAPGMGLNAFFAYNIAAQVGFESALTVTFLSGIGYLLVVLTPAREKLTKLMPANLKLAIGAGIGFFVAYVGLQNAGIIVKDSGPALVSRLGDFGHPYVLVAIILLIVGLVLHYTKIPGAIIITMLVGAIIIIPMIATGVAGANPDNINPLKVGYKGFDDFSKVALSGWEGFINVEMWKSPITYIGVLSFMYMDFFDTTGTLMVIDKEIGLSEKEDKWLSKANLVDAISTLVGAGIGATTTTSFVESTVGVKAGAKTGFAMVITSLCFGLSIALWPIIQVFMPIVISDTLSYQPITGPILIIVGTMMINQIKHFEWQIFADIPTLFITMIMMMLSNSIAYGIAFGTITFVIINAALGLTQRFIKKQKNVVNTAEIPLTDGVGITQKTREYDYLKRINIALILISIISITYIILQNGITYYDWFKFN